MKTKNTHIPKNRRKRAGRLSLLVALGLTVASLNSGHVWAAGNGNSHLGSNNSGGTSSTPLAITAAEPDLAAGSMVVSGQYLGDENGQFSGQAFLWAASLGFQEMAVTAYNDTEQELLVHLPAGLSAFPGSYLLYVVNGNGPNRADNFSVTIGSVGAAGAQGPQGEPGIQGPIGPIGPQGLQGEQGGVGPIGPIGPQGAQGLSWRGPWILVTPYFASEAVEFNGSSWIAKRMNVGAIPVPGDDWELLAQKGDTGETGPQGPQGEVGPQGPQGDQGIAGPVGPVGPQGEQGLIGLTGAKGNQGEVGPQGPQGDQGVAGPVGPQGEQGLIGLTGAKGDQGEVGPQGPQGEQGIQGPIGLTGPQGLQGLTGLTGAQGPLGPIGPQGPAGLDGLNGLDGEQGPIGPQGDQGPQGEVGPQGLQGLVWQGAWSSGTTYFENDAVFYQGSTWIANQASVGATPTEGADWSLVAMKGDTGDQGVAGAIGPQGPQGIQGDVGPQGSQGIAGSTGPEGPVGAEGPQGPVGPSTTTDNTHFIGSDQDNDEADSTLSLGVDGTPVLTVREGGRVGVGVTPGSTFHVKQTDDQNGIAKLDRENDEMVLQIDKIGRIGWRNLKAFHGFNVQGRSDGDSTHFRVASLQDTTLFGVQPSGDATVAGNVTATGFNGSGAGLTDLPVANLIGSVTSSQLDPAIGLWDAAGGDVSRASGKVGVGIVPGSTMHVRQSAGSGIMKLEKTDSSMVMQVDVAGRFGFGRLKAFNSFNIQGIDPTDANHFRVASPQDTLLFGVQPDGDATVAGTLSAVALEGNLNAANLTGTIDSARIGAGSIGGGKLANGSVDSATIANGSVATADIAGNAITSGKIASGAVETTDIADSAITTSKIASFAVDSGQLAAQAINSSKIADGAVTSIKIAAGAVDSAQLASGSVGSGKLKDAAVGTLQLADDAVSNDKIANNAVQSLQIAPGAVSTTDIANFAVSADKIGNGAVSALKLANNSVTSGKLATDAVTNAKIADDAVTSAEIADGTITEDDLAFSVAGGAWTESGSDIYRSSGKVGIGDTTPNATLHVVQSSSSTDSLRVDDTSGTMLFEVDNNGSAGYRNAYDDVAFTVRSRTSDVKSFVVENDGANPLLTVDTGGHVGVRSNPTDVTFNVTGRTDDTNWLRVTKPDGTTSAFRVKNGEGTHVDLGDLTVHNGDVNIDVGRLVAKLATSIFSDRRLKHSITNLNDVMSRVMQLRPLTYRLNADGPDGKDQIGFVAQEADELFPLTVNKEREFLSMNYTAYGVIAIKAIQEQQAQIEEKDSRIKALEARVTQLEQVKTEVAAKDEAMTALQARLEKLEGMVDQMVGGGN